jgi:hypothetical protein
MHKHGQQASRTFAIEKWSLAQSFLTDDEIVIDIHGSIFEFFALFDIPQCSTYYMSTFREDKHVGLTGVVNMGCKEAEMRPNVLQDVRRSRAAGIEMDL